MDVPGQRRWSEHQEKFRAHYRELFSDKQHLSRMTLEEFTRFFTSDELANVGPARFAAESTLKELGPAEFLEKSRAALEYLLFEERRSLEERLTDLVDGHRSPALKGVREAILTKVLAAAWPERVFPALVYDSKDGSGKRQVADALLGLPLPAKDRSGWTIGRLAVWSNDLFVDLARILEFQDLHTAADFIWWLWKRHQDGEFFLSP
jgi:hypothetical protein